MSQEIEEIAVDLGKRGYTVYAGAGALERFPAAAKDWRPRIAIVDENVLRLHHSWIEKAVEPDNILVIPPGEASKSLREFARLQDRLIELKVPRQAVVVTVGGGVTGDLGGFVAATYLRGVAWINVPTTLLAQVDAAVGGKVAVNRGPGKNLIGAFYQPRAVLSDTGFLATLDRRQMVSGLFEHLKHALLTGDAAVRELERDFAALARGNPEALTRAVAQSIRSEALFVAADEREAGRRAFLNLGHTLGHALEDRTGATESRLLHGEAVGIGIWYAAILSEMRGWIGARESMRMERLVRGLRPVEAWNLLEPEALMEKMLQDKKRLGGRIRFVLLRSFGRPELVEVEAPEILAAHAVLGERMGLPTTEHQRTGLPTPKRHEKEWT